ncbi:filamentous hemagglutinin N-terminal domain-containing protein [Chlorobaculum sp. MV4-Y]|uniref:two-partner secretion domain-containing protein n=1 Tax=Chlorobaculum sp. MV4-Y TaxID=2976335 RepID=UPI0021AFC3DC|nr:autotransporter-associated beta strand repeat-containing protein [Chlorobaculum sp. MV4-Y]UWX57108.1 filamentous hemagglutinin N-terminal domain-containing protein [Chlorobaculum sp. MV4-Y]
MNKIFRIIWSAVKDKWIVVSEKSSAKGAPMFTIGGIISLAALMAMSSPAMALDAGALPTGGQVASGSATISTSGTQMTVNQSSQQLIANWSTFNIGQDASVNFAQPNSTSVALNRIADQNPSQILGTLTANGNIMLVNRAGVMFGKTATVNVGGLIASSLDISDSDFFAGNYQFTNAGAAGAVVNEGSITAANGGVVAMIAPQVTNNGTISAPSGSVAMMAGDQVSVQFLGDGMISYTVDKGTIDALAANNGLIQADGGLVVMTAKAADALMKSVVNQTGIVQATGMKEDGGRIILDVDGGQTTVSGTLDASSAEGKGGSVVVTGDNVLVQNGANITASGATGGGEVLVGGGYQGNNANVRNAQNVTVESGSTITADATDNGDGGTVVLWSDLATAFAGSISAEGGPNGGNGGFAEVSSKQYLDYTGFASLLAPQGDVGTLLLDPHSIAIVGSGTSTPAADYSYLTTAYLNNQLAGANVTLSASNDINFLANLTYTGANNRTLNLYAPTIALTGNGTNFTIDSSTANLNLVFGKSTSQRTLLLADTSINTHGGNVTFNGNVGGDHSLTITAAQTTFNDGATGGFTGSYWSGSTTPQENPYTFSYRGATYNHSTITVNFTNATVTSTHNGSTVPVVFTVSDGGTFYPGNVTFEAGHYIDLPFGGGTNPTVIGPTGTLTKGTGPGNGDYYITSSGSGSESRIVFNQKFVVSSISYCQKDARSPYIDGNWLAQLPNNVDYTAPVLTSLTVNGPTNITGNITTTEDQTYNGNVNIVGKNSVLTARDVKISSASSVVDLNTYNLTVNNTGNLSLIAGPIIDTGSLTKAGTGTLTLTGNNTYSGTTTISNGTLQVGNGGTSGTLGTGNVTDNSHLVFNRSDASSYGGVISGTGDVTKNGAGTLTLTGNNTYSGPTAINAGTLQVGNGGTSGTLGTGLVTDNANLLFYRSDAVSLGTLAGGGIVGTGDVTADIGGNFTIDRNIAMTGSGSEVTLASRGGNVSIDGTQTVSTSSTGTITVYSGTPDTTNLFARMSGPDKDGLKYKTYGVTYGVGSQTIHTGTYNFFYRSTPTLTVTLTDTKTYDGTNTQNNPQLVSVVPSVNDGDSFGALAYGDLVTSAVTFSSVNAGNGIPLNFTVIDNDVTPIVVDNWSISGYDVQGAGTGTINKAPLTITGGTTSHQYDATPYTNTYSVSGTLYGSDAVTGVSTLGTGTNAGTYNDNLTSATGNGLSNYQISYVNGSLTITKAPLTITGGTTSHQYDATQYTNSYSITAGELYGSDTLTGVSTLGTGTNAGTYNDNLTSATGNGLSNYQISYVNGSLTITKAPLTITANDDSKTYDTVAYTGGNGVQYSGFVGGQDYTVLGGVLYYTGSSQGAVDPGTYAIIPAGLTSSNYDITFDDGVLTIEQGLNPFDLVELTPPGPVIVPENVIGPKGSNPIVNTTGMDFGSFAELTTGSAAELIAAGESTGGGSPFEQGGEVRTVAMTNEGEVAPSEITTGTVAETNAQVIVKLVRNAEAGKPGLVDVLIPEEMLRSGSSITFELPKEVKVVLLNGNGKETVKLENGQSLPAWMTYNSGNKSFTAINPPSNAFPLKVKITDSSMRSWVVDVMVR